MNQSEFTKALDELQILLRPEQKHQFAEYHEHLQEWTQRVRLVSKNDQKRIWERHFLDSLTAIPLIPEGSSRVLDLGSGAGFPGMPLKIAVPELDVVLLEPARMKALFLRSLIEKLEVTGVTCVRERAEAPGFISKFKGEFDIIVSRAVGPLRLLCDWGRPLLKMGGKMLVFKGPDGLREMKDGSCEHWDIVAHPVDIFFASKNRYLMEMKMV